MPPLARGSISQVKRLFCQNRPLRLIWWFASSRRERDLKNAVTVEHLTQGPALEQLAPRRILLTHFFGSLTDHFLLYRQGDHHHSIKICKYQLAGMHQHITATNRDIVRHHQAAPFAVHGTNARVKDGKTRGHNAPAIADETVAHATHGTVVFGDGSHQFAPRSVGTTGVRGVDDDIP